MRQFDFVSLSDFQTGFAVCRCEAEMVNIRYELRSVYQKAKKGNRTSIDLLCH